MGTMSDGPVAGVRVDDPPTDAARWKRRAELAEACERAVVQKCNEMEERWHKAEDALSAARSSVCVDDREAAAPDERETELLREIETLRDELAALRPTPPAVPPTPGSGSFSFGVASPGSSDPMPPERRAEYQRRIEQANERHRIER